MILELEIAGENGYFPSESECLMRLCESQGIGMAVGANVSETGGLVPEEIADIPELFSNRESRESIYNNTVVKILNL